MEQEKSHKHQHNKRTAPLVCSMFRLPFLQEMHEKSQTASIATYPVLYIENRSFVKISDRFSIEKLDTKSKGKRRGIIKAPP